MPPRKRAASKTEASGPAAKKSRSTTDDAFIAASGSKKIKAMAEPTTPTRQSNRVKAKQDEAVKTVASSATASAKKGKTTVNEKNDKAKKAKTEDKEVEQDDEKGENGRSYWLMKAEPDSRFEKGVDVKFSIDDLKEKSEPEAWDGVRNPGARNNMRSMRKGDLAFFYHSNCKVPGIAGIMEIFQEHSVDDSAFDDKHPYYDAKSTRDNPKWSVVHVEFRKKLDTFIKLKELQKYKQQGGVLENMQVLKMSRLSVSKVSKMEWEFICGLADIDGATLEDKKDGDDGDGEGEET